jgi:hypothetical protein
MLLVYYRLYVTYTLAVGFLFDLDQSNVCRDIQKTEGLIRECLPIPQKVYSITKMIQTQEEVEQYFPGFMTIIDRTGQQIQSRHENKINRKAYFLEKPYHKESQYIKMTGPSLPVFDSDINSNIINRSSILIERYNAFDKKPLIMNSFLSFV